MLLPKLTTTVGELTATQFSVHNCPKRQLRLACRVVVYQFSGTAPVFDTYEYGLRDVGSSDWIRNTY